MASKLATKKTASSTGHMSSATKWFTWILTTAAALTALLVNARNLGLAPWLGADLGFATHHAHRVVVAPKAESLYAIGDTTVLAATVTDRRGAVLVGAQLDWSTDDSNVAVVDSAGTVVARGPGRSRVTAKVRDLTSEAVVTVLQRPARVMIPGDSAVRIHEGDTIQFAAIALDARGHRIARASPRWHSGDTLIVKVDSLGTAIGQRAGNTSLWAGLGDGGAAVSVEVDLTATTLTLVTGDGQRALAGRRLPEPIVLRALARGGQPVPGATVSLLAADGEGQVEPATVTADREGRIRVNWTLSPRAGPQRLLARLSPADTAFVIAAEADPVPGNTRVELLGTVSGGRVSEQLDQPVVLHFTDSAGAALAQVPVTWALLDGGTVAASHRTDSLGGATARWTLGPKAGRQRLQAQVGNPRAIPPFTVAVTAQPGPLAAITVQDGQNQQGTVAKPLPKPIVVVARDAAGNPISDVAVTARTAQGATSDTALTTDARGRGVFRWTLGPTAGDQSVEVRVEGLPTALKVTARAVAGPPANLALNDLAMKNAAGGTLRLIATVTDAIGNPVPDATVAFATSSGKLSAKRLKCDHAGRAQVDWTPGVTLGERRVTATVQGTKLSTTKSLQEGAGRAKRRT
jgi:adhesin/invasin